MPVNAVPMMISPTGEDDTRSQETENQLAKLCRKLHKNKSRNRPINFTNGL